MPRLLRYALVAIGVVAVAGSMRWAERTFGELEAIDFYIYYVAAHLDERRDLENIYDEGDRHRIAEEEFARATDGHSDRWWRQAKANRRIDTVSSPFLYTCLTWLPRDFDLALTWYRRLQVLSLIGAVLILGAALRLPWGVSLLLAAALVRFELPFHHDVFVGNVSSFQLLMLAAFLWLIARSPVLGGAMLALALAFKPTIGYVFVLLLVSRIASRDYARLWRELAGGAAGALFAFAAAAVNFGSPRIWPQWIPAAGGFYGRLPGRDSNNVAPALPLYEAWGNMWSFAVAGVLLAIVAVILFRRRTRDDAMVVAAGVLVYLLSAPVVWVYYLVLALFPAIVLLPRRWLAIAGVTAMIAISGQHMILLNQMRPLDQYVVTPSLVILFAAAAWCAGRHDFPPRERRY